MPGARPIILAWTTAIATLTLATTGHAAGPGGERRVDRVADLFRLVLRDDVIQIETDLPPTDGPVAVRSPELPAGGEIDLREGGQPARRYPVFSFWTPPRSLQEMLGSTAVQSQLNRLWISQDVAGIRSVSLHQELPGNPAAPAGADGAGLVRLHVQAMNPVTGTEVDRKELEAASLPDLRHLHPREFNEFVIPMLRTLGQERSLLAPDPTVAFQVLLGSGGDGGGDAALVAEVRALVARLDSPDAATRDTAGRKLSELGRRATVVLVGLDRGGLSAEQNSRIDALLATDAPLADAAARALGDDPMFLVDCLYLPDPAVRAAALDRLRTVTGQDLTFDPSKTGKDELSAISELRARAIGSR